MSQRMTRIHIFGLIGLLMLLTGSFMGLFLAPSERYMGDVQRIMYVHLPTAWNGMLCYTFVLTEYAN